MLYERIPVIQPRPLNVGPLNIQKFKGVKTSVEEWLAMLNGLNQSDIVSCSCCDDAISDEALVPVDNAASDEVHSGADDEVETQLCLDICRLMKLLATEIELEAVHSDLRRRRSVILACGLRRWTTRGVL